MKCGRRLTSLHPQASFYSLRFLHLPSRAELFLDAVSHGCMLRRRSGSHGQQSRRRRSQGAACGRGLRATRAGGQGSVGFMQGCEGDLSMTERSDGLPFHFIGSSPTFRAIRDIGTGVAGRQSTVMILGETGSGKEMLARHIHEHSNRKRKPFIPVDCSSLVDGLFESELFGHVRGAFTGATRDSLGFIRAADGGTLFLDEVGELGLSVQAKLLRVLQERRVVPVGEQRSRPVDVRVITATHRDLPAMVRAGTFRQDLFFRLNVIVLNLPPLRERRDDVVPLANHFLRAQALLYGETPKRLTAPAARALLDYPWPGNVRELANVMEQAHVLSPGPEIELVDLPERLQVTGANADASAVVHSDLRLEDLERRAIAEALSRAKFSKAAASRMLGINIQRLNRRIARLGIRSRPG